MKLKTKLCVAALTVVSAGLALPAIAQVGGGSYPSTSTQSGPGSAAPTASPSADFSKLDANGDGSISKQEARKDKAVGKAFDSLDTNKDGKLDASEFAAYSGSSGAPGSKP